MGDAIRSIGVSEVTDLFMRAGQPQTPERRGVGAQLVCNQQLRCKALFPAAALAKSIARIPENRQRLAFGAEPPHIGGSLAKYASLTAAGRR